VCQLAPSEAPLFYLRYIRRTILLSLVLAPLSVPALAQFETRGVSEAPLFPVSVATGDFNQDGKLDLAVVSTSAFNNGVQGYSTTVQVFLGKGDGTFQKAVSYTVGTTPVSIATADFNGDGILDLVIVNAGTDNFSVLLGRGDGTFLPAVNYSTPPDPIFVTAGDFNGDGKLDIATINISDSTGTCKCVAIYLGNGDGTFQEPPIITTPSMEPFAIGVGNFSADGHLDLAVAEEFGGTNQVEVLLGNGDGTFHPGQIENIAAGPLSITVADFNSDHNQDLAIAELEGESVGVLLGNGDGTFQPEVRYATTFPLWVTAADVNGDGKQDLVSSNLLSPFSGVTVFTGNGDGTFQTGVYYPDGGTNTGQINRYVTVADVNNDGKPDIITPDSGTSDVIVLLNTGAVSFSPTTPITFLTQLIGTTSAPMTATLTNNGTTALTISSVTFSGNQFKARTTCQGSVAPGGNCTITATFTPKVQGTITGTVSINDSASSKPQVVELLGTGTVVKFSPAQLTFAKQKVGTKSAPQVIQLTNTGKTSLKFENFIYVGGTNANDFSQTNNCGHSLKAGATCNITVTFTPQRTGARSALIEVPDNAGGSPQTAALTGTGD
jgi:FG-GAP-like repeat/Abnormal spindle-like microcephaly-assoc'd, ASPM-SPD-2-Hydin